MSAPSFTFVVPIHNEEQNLAATIARLDAAQSTYRIERIIGVENGSSDQTWPLLQQLSERYQKLEAFREPSAGIGYAYHRGMVEALRGTTSDYLVLTACDLPFGFTDVESMLALGGRPEVCIGSKAKLVGSVTPSLKRRAVSLAYLLARRWTVGMKTRDSQGSFLIRTDVARAYVDRIRARDFFFTTELCALLERDGIRPVEVSVVLEEELRASTVRTLRHGTALFRQLITLRRRLHDESSR